VVLRRDNGCGATLRTGGFEEIEMPGQTRVRISIAFTLFVWIAGPSTPRCAAAIYRANHSNYVSRVARLKAGDTLDLEAGTYKGLTIKGLHGTAFAWIVITGPSSGPPAVIEGAGCCNTVEILNSSFVSIENLTVDSKGIEGTFGVSAKDGLSNLTHDIRIQNDRFIGQGGSQQTVAISTKIPTWGWIIRHNQISGAGTGIYLGNSDGSMPFVGGLIENNIIEDTIGYNIEIKWQRRRPPVAGMPASPRSTIIRNNVFIKDGRPSPDGDRPNVLVGGFPDAGAGADDLYEIYGNVFVNNPRESLLQASGRVSIHDNIFVGGDYAAVALQAQDLPLKLAHVYNNTIYTRARGIVFGTAATLEGAVVGNLIFASVPLAGAVKHAAENVVETPAHAGQYVKSPSFDFATMDFYPLAGKCTGTPLDLAPFASETDYALDFNGAPKQGMMFRGAYAGAGTNPGWKLQDAEKSAALPAAASSALEITPSTASRGESGSFLVMLHAPRGTNLAGLQWVLSAGAGIAIQMGDIVVGSAAAEAEKTLVCLPVADHAGKQPAAKCLLAGGGKKIPDGPIAIVRYHVDHQAQPGPSTVRIERILGVTADLKAVDLGDAGGTLTVQ
jgi:hypothetical protein